MNPKFSHPYKDHPEPLNWPDDKHDEIDELYEWLQNQPRFPKMTKNHVHQFYHSCYYNKEETKKAFQRYVELRASAPECFGIRDPLLPAMQNVYTATNMVALPKLTKEGYRILSYRLKDYTVNRLVFGEGVKAFNMFNDVIISVDGPINGYVVIFDMEGVCLRHLTRVQIGPLRNFMAYIQEAHPVRLKKIYIVHAAWFVNQAFAIARPFIKTELMSLLHFTTGGPDEIFPLDILPLEYGGELKSLDEFHEEQKERLENEYREWLIDSSNLKLLPKEKKSDKKQMLDANANNCDPPVASLNKLSVD